MTMIYLAWQEPVERRWIPVARPTFDGEKYRFVYTKGARSPRFLKLGRFSDLNSIYESAELFPIFSNRLLHKNRPEYEQYLKWLDIAADHDDAISILSRTEGLRATDSLELFPCPVRSPEGRYFARFFAHGLRYLDTSAISRIGKLGHGDPLFLMEDVQNPADPLAIAIRSQDPPTIIGYCPRYLTADFRQLLKGCGPQDVRASVERVNQGAPLQLRLLCSVTACWPDGFNPCADEVYQPIPPGA
jgi:hypothetical protein